MSKLKKSTIGLAVIINALGIFIAYFYKPQLATIDADNLKPSLSRYLLDPFHTLDFSRDELPYPYVSKKPGTTAYLLLEYVEKYQLATNQADFLFFTGKRISELRKWGDELSVSGNVTNIGTLSEARFVTDSWEYVLNKYSNTMQKTVNRAQAYEREFLQDQEKYEVAKHIAVHRRDMNELTSSLGKPIEQKNYLQELTKLIFDDLEHQLGITSTEKIEFNEREYSLGVIGVNKDFGNYTIKIDKNDLPADSIYSLPRLLDSSGNISLEFSDKEKYYEISSMPLNESVENLTLRAPLKNIVEDVRELSDISENCTSEFRKRGNYSVFYEVKTSQDLFEDNLFSFTPENSKISENVQLLSDSSDGCKTEMEYLPVKDSKNSLSVSFKSTNPENHIYYLAISSNNETPKILANSLFISKYIDPTLLLIKLNDNWVPDLKYKVISDNYVKIELADANLYQFNSLKNTVTFPYKIVSQEIGEGQNYTLEVKNNLPKYLVLALIIIDTAAISLLKRKSLKRSFKVLGEIYSSVATNLKRLVLKYRTKTFRSLFYFSVFLTFIISLTDIFLIRSIIDPIYLVPLLFLSLAALVLGISYRLFILLGLFYIVFSWLMYLLNIGNYIGGPVDKASYWGYYLVLIGALFMIIKGNSLKSKKK